MSTVTERDQSIRQICDCLESWIAEADVVGSRAEALRCAGNLVRQFEVPTATKRAALKRAVGRCIITAAESREIL